MQNFTLNKLNSFKLTFIAFLLLTSIQIRAQYTSSQNFENTAPSEIKFDEEPVTFLNGNTQEKDNDGYLILINNDKRSNIINTTSVTTSLKLTAIPTTGVTICKGGTGSLTATSSSKTATTFSGHWNSDTDPKAATVTTSMANSAICGFSLGAIRNYTATTFTVSRSGNYNFKMTDTRDYDGAAYIYTGNFTPGSCSGGGTWIIGDDDYDGIYQEPRLITYLNAGVNYTLISTLWASSTGTYVGDYTWTVSPAIILNTLNYWYTSMSGGNPIGWGNSFNPVGVAGSGLSNTNRAGTTTYYVSDGTTNSARTPVDFVIKEDAAVSAASATPTLCVNQALTNITHAATGVTGIEEVTGLPLGVIATLTANTLTISGTPTVSGTFNYNIQLTGGCEVVAATGKIIVNPEPADIFTNGITICKGDTGLLTATSGTGILPTPVTVFTDRWNVSTDPQSLMPGIREDNVPKCIFYSDVYGNYTTISFSVNVSGTYTLQMTGENRFLRAGYIYKGNYSMGTCPENGTWVTGDDDYGVIGAKNPTLTAHLEVGTLYTLVSLINAAFEDPNYSADYTWTLTPPAGGGFFLTPLNLWYTSPVGGDPIGWGPYLNPVEAPGSGMLNTNTPGSTTYYAGDLSPCSVRVPATFVIKEDNIAGIASSTPTLCTNTALTNITHTTKGATGIGEATELPSGVTAIWTNNKITISGTPTEAGTFNYSIPLTGGCGSIAATGQIIVTPKPQEIVTTERICFGETFKWLANGTVYNENTSLTIINDYCTANQVLNLTVGSKINTPFTQVNVNCKGESNGSVSIIPNGGTAPYNIIPAQTNLAAGTHTFTVTDANSCTTEVDVIITEPETLSAVFTQINVSCNGLSNASVDITPSGGTKPYIITPPQTNLAAGSYTFTITDDNYCTTDVDVTITEPEIFSAVFTQTNVSCNGLSNASVDITPSGGTKPYIITPPQTNLAAGSYTFTITDDNYCTTDVDVIITEPALLSAVSAQQVNVSCNGLSDGSVKVIVSGGTEPYSITPTTGLNAGTHTFIITDDNGCTTEVEVNITEPETLSAVFTQTNVSCNGLSDGSVKVTVSGGTAPYNIPPTTGLNAGKHTITITDTNGCTTEVEVNITEPETLSAVFTQTNVSCNGLADGSVKITASGGTEPYDIPSTTGLKAGKYTFTITDANNCTTEVPVIITEPQVLSTVFTQINVSCNGMSDGSVDIKPSGGTIPYDIPSTTGLKAGKHIFTITDANGCITDVQVNITQPAVLSAVSAKQINVSCNGLSDGSVEITAFGGTAPYNIPPTTGLNAGRHIFTITDANGCTTEVQVIITEPALLSAVSTKQVNVSCNGLSDGSVLITASGGTAPYAIPSTTGLNAGKHTFTITDTNGCTTNVEVNITQPDVLTAISTKQVDVKCKGEATGSVLITASGGTGPYTITPPQTGLTAGAYIFNVIDSQQCSTEVRVTITEPLMALKATIQSQADVTCKGNADGSVLITPSGGTAPYDITPSQIGLAAGTHTFTVKDYNNCSTTIKVTITEPAMALSASIKSQVNVKCKGEASGSVLITPSGGTAPYTITPGQTGLSAGVHTFTVTDYNNCKTTIKATITEPAMPLSATIKTQFNVECKGEAGGSVLIIPSGGTGPYVITPPQTGLMAGDYTFTVTDANNCTTPVQVTITEPLLLQAKVLQPLLPEFCQGDKDGAFSIEISGGTMPYSYSLDSKKGPFVKSGPQQTVMDLNGLSQGKHMVYIIDALGCTAQIEAILPDAVKINPMVEISTDCVRNANANSVRVTVDSSIDNPADVDYSLDGGTYQSGNVFTNLTPGKHTITARHSNGCTRTAKEFTIQYIEPLALSIQDGELNQILATPNGGQGPYRYSFEGEPYTTENKFTIYKSGVYQVNITDKNGCTATVSRYFEYIDLCIPNHFTPNGDGINDQWAPGCSTSYKNLTFAIFDRYGRIIGNFKYGQKWDGKYNGNELSSGDYWYVLKLNDNKDNREFVGHFTLYR